MKKLLIAILSIVCINQLSASTLHYNNEKIETCWWCIVADISGGASGIGVGMMVGGPIGAAIGGAVLGAAESAREYHENGNNPIDLPVISDEEFSALDSELFPPLINNSYATMAGKGHNIILHKTIVEEFEITDLEQYYEFAIQQLSLIPEFEAIFDSEEYEVFANPLKEEVLGELASIIAGNDPSYGEETEGLVATLNGYFQDGYSESYILGQLDALVTSCEEDISCLQTISIAYFSWKYWKFY